MIKSIGEEDDRAYEPSVTREYTPGDKAWEVQKESKVTLSSVPKATQLATFSGTFSTGYYLLDFEDTTPTLIDTLSVVRWSSGRLTIGGSTYRIRAGSTRQALKGQLLPTTVSLMNDDPMPFYIYFDPTISTTSFQVAPIFKDFGSGNGLVKKYEPAAWNHLLAWCRRGAADDTHAEWGLITGAAGQVPSFIRQNAQDVVKVDSISAALHRKGTQPFAWNGTIVPKSGSESTVITLGQTSGTNPLISFADNTTAMIANGDISVPSAGTYYLYFDIVNLTKDANGQYGSSSQPVPITLGSGLTAFLAATNDYRGLLAIIDKSSDPNQSIAIQTFGTKTGNINADNIAANSITAAAIATGALDAEIITLTGGGYMRTAANVGNSGGPAGIKISSGGLEAFSGGTTRTIFINPSTGKIVFGTPQGDVDQDNLNVWGQIDGRPLTLSALDSTAGAKLGGIESLATVGADWGSNIDNQPTDAQLLNSNVALAIDSNGGFSLTNGAGAATDARGEELKRKIFRTTSNSAAPPNGPYNVGDWWVTSTTHTNTAQRGTNTATSNNSGTSSNASHWVRVSPPSSIMSPNEVTINGANITAGTVTADYISSSFSLTNVLVAGTGALGSSLDGVVLSSAGLRAQDGGVDQVYIDAAGSNPGSLYAAGGKVVLNAHGISIREDSSNPFIGYSLYYGNHDWNSGGIISIGVDGSPFNNGLTYGMYSWEDVGKVKISRSAIPIDEAVWDWNGIAQDMNSAIHGPGGADSDDWWTLPSNNPGSIAGNKVIAANGISADGALNSPYGTTWTDTLTLGPSSGNGSAGSPTYSFASDSNSGLYRSGGARLSIAISGVKFMDMDYYGSTSPSRRFGVAGDYESGYALKVHGATKKTTSGGEWDAYSDDRIKESVTAITNATTTLKALNPVSFKFTEEWRSAALLPDVTEHGFLASNFGTVFPDRVTTGNTSLIKLSDNTHVEMMIHETDEKLGEPLPDGATMIVENIKSLNGGELTAYLVAAIKELEARIAALES